MLDIDARTVEADVIYFHVRRDGAVLLLPCNMVDNTEAIPSDVHSSIPVLVDVTSPDDAFTSPLRAMSQRLAGGCESAVAAVRCSVLHDSLIVHRAPSAPICLAVTVDGFTRFIHRMILTLMDNERC